MGGLGSAALAAAKLFGGIEKGKLEGRQRAREDLNAANADAEEQRRAMLDQLVKMSTVNRNRAETAETARRTAAMPGSWAEMLEREAAKSTPPAPRNIDPLSREGVAAATERARKIAGATAPFQKSTTPRADPEEGEARQVERERRRYVVSRTQELRKEGLDFTKAKLNAEAEAQEIYGGHKPLGDPRARTTMDPPAEPASAAERGPAADAPGRDADLARQAEEMIKAGEGTFEQAMASKYLSEGAKAILRRRMGKKPEVTSGRDRY